MDRIKNLFLRNETVETQETLEKFTNENDTYSPPIPEIINVCNKEDECKIGTNLFTDVEFYTSYYDDSQTILDSVSNNIHLSGSKFYFKEILTHPIYSKKVLEQRQDVIKEFKNFKDSHIYLEKLRENENDFLWLIDIKNNNNSYDILYDMVYINTFMLNKMNQSQEFLSSYNIYRIVVSPLIGVLSPICYFIIPYMILKIKLKMPITFSGYIRTLFMGLFKSSGNKGLFGKIQYISCAFSLIFYFQGLFNSFELANASFKISKTIVTKMNNVIEFIKLSKKLNDQVWTDNIGAFINDDNIILDEKLSYFENYNKREFNLFSNFGFELKIFKFIKINSYIPLIRRMYILDTIFAFTKINNFSYAEYIDRVGPVLEINGLWHPCISDEKVVKNDIQIGHGGGVGGIENKNNVIITGPNAGGKSTFIKSTIINIIFAQTLGICPCDSIKLTPFYYISSQINIPDCKGKESLFEAEMHRSLDNINIIQSLSKDKFSFLVMDEIFNSTNPIEGISGAYAICKKLASIDNSINIISTHYLYLTKLAKHFRKQFTNYKINVNIDENNKITYPYKISRGVSKQTIAIELLKENGFDQDIIETALEIKKKLSTV